MISYAQNFEDAMLARLFPNKRDGFYVDVGAHDPTVISVTRYFYDIGWHGINIEPVPEDHAKFVRDRPRDINLQLAVGDRPGRGTIHIVDGSSDSCALGSALSSMDAEEAREGAALVGNHTIRSVEVEVATLADILARHCPDTPIDFL